jgi:hypothetical protein
MKQLLWYSLYNSDERLLAENFVNSGFEDLQ